MATAKQQARYRARDRKRLVQIRLSPEALDWLDGLVSERQATGRAEILEAMLTGQAADPRTLASDGLRLVRGYLLQTGKFEVSGTDEDGGVIAARLAKACFRSSGDKGITLGDKDEWR